MEVTLWLISIVIHPLVRETDAVFPICILLHRPRRSTLIFLDEATFCEGVITSEMDFFNLTTLCERLVSELLECHDDTLSLALAGRLACALEALSAALERPIPEYLYPTLTAKEPSPELPLCLGSEEPILKT